MLSRGEMQHLCVGLAGGFWREGGSTASCPFPNLGKRGSLSKAGLWLFVVIFLPGNTSPSGVGWEGREEGMVRGRRWQIKIQTEKSYEDLKGEKLARKFSLRHKVWTLGGMILEVFSNLCDLMIL